MRRSIRWAPDCWFPSLLAFLLLSGCEKPFEPLAPSDLAFSIYGHLDAALDTQWVRVTPIRASLTTLPEPIDAVVTLEEIETGTTVVMSDSLTRYQGNLAGSSSYAHNFFTTMPMVPGRHYRLTATRSDGAASSATVLVPAWTSPTLVVNHTFQYPTSSISGPMAVMARASGTIGGARHLGMVFGGRNPECCDWSQPSPAEFLPILLPAAVEGADHRVQMSWGTDSTESVPAFVGTRLRDQANTITVVATGEPWPYEASMQLRELSHTHAINNVEGGIGYLAGTHTYVFPFDACVPTERTIPCTITFSPASATLIAVVTNGCTGEPFPAVRAQLLGSREDGIRSEATGTNGKVGFPGMKAGAGHSLLFEAPVPPGRQEPNFFPVEVENVVLAEAAVDTVSIVMAHRGDCPPPDGPIEAGIQGAITNAATRTPLAGASITLGQGGVVVHVTHADLNGFYQIGSIIPGVYTLRVSLPGFVTHEEALPMAPRDRHIRSIELAPVPQLMVGSASSAELPSMMSNLKLFEAIPGRQNRDGGAAQPD